jgi:hypothetical protein
MAVALGWRWRSVVEVVIVLIAVTAVAKVAGRMVDRRREAARR